MYKILKISQVKKYKNYKATFGKNRETTISPDVVSSIQ